MNIGVTADGYPTMTIDMQTTAPIVPHRASVPAATFFTTRVLIEGVTFDRSLTYFPDPRPFSAPLWVMVA